MPEQKPSSCQQCPLYGDGLGWVPDLIRESAEVLVITMFPSQYEATQGVPRIGIAVEEYQREYERYAGPVTMSYANVVRCRGQRGTKLPTGARLREGALYCRQYDYIPETTKLVVYQGIDVAKHLTPTLEYPLGWRGFLLARKEESNDVVGAE